MALCTIYLRVIPTCNLNTHWDLEALKLALQLGSSASLIPYNSVQTPLTQASACTYPCKPTLPSEWGLNLSIKLPSSSTLITSSVKSTGAALLGSQSLTPRSNLNCTSFISPICPLSLHWYISKINKHIKQSTIKTPKEKGKMENWGEKNKIKNLVVRSEQLLLSDCSHANQTLEAWWKIIW